MNKTRLLILFVLAAMIFSIANPAAATPSTVTLEIGTATFSQPGPDLNVDLAVDGITTGYDVYGNFNGWAIYNDGTEAQTAVWETSSDLNASQLDFALYHTWGAVHSLGRFRLSYTTDDRSMFADGLNSGGDVTANWIELTGATISSTGGETFTILGDNSILVSGPSPGTTVYSVSFAGSFIGVTGIRLEALSDPSLPDNGPGRGGNGNFHLVEITLDAVIDSDGDGVPDDQDDFPNDPTETTDSDGDGVGDNADAFPNDPGETADSDGDGVGDNADAFPNDPGETADSDGDGVGDNSDPFPDNVLVEIDLLLNDPEVSDEAKDKLEKAKNKLEKARDDLMQGDVKKGLREVEKAVKKLLKAADEGADVADLIDLLVESARTLAQDAIDAAIAAGGDQEEIDKALNEMIHAQNELDKGHPHHAIKEYSKAWKKAQKSLE